MIAIAVSWPICSVDNRTKRRELHGLVKKYRSSYLTLFAWFDSLLIPSYEDRRWWNLSYPVALPSPTKNTSHRFLINHVGAKITLVLHHLPSSVVHLDRMLHRVSLFRNWSYSGHRAVCWCLAFWKRTTSDEIFTRNDLVITQDLHLRH